jgi:regulator of nucleoside diphosphate kinase
MTDSSAQLFWPVGAALIGLRTGDTIHWDLPGGTSTHLEVLELLTSQKRPAITFVNPF